MVTWADPNDPQTIIDAHVHLWPKASSDFPRVPKINLEVTPEIFTEAELFDEGAAFGISRTVVVQHIGYYGYDNRYPISLKDKFPNRVAVIGAVGEAEADGPSRLEDLAKAGGRGVRVRGINVSAWLQNTDVLALWEKAQELGIAVCLLLRNRDDFDMTPFAALARLAERFPNLTIVIDHMAFVDPDDEVLRRELAELSRFPKIHLKLSGFERNLKGKRAALKGMVHQYLEHYDAERIMWGSDRPVLGSRGGTLREVMEFVRNDLELPPATLHQILRGTAEAMFFDSKAY